MDIKEKFGAALAYLTLGIWGLIWLLISRTPAYFQKDFIRFHCLQSIMIGIFYMFLPQGISIFFTLISQILSIIPGIMIVTDAIHFVHTVLQQIVHYGGLVLILYCVIFSLYGRYTNIPWVSQMVNKMMR